MNTTEEKRIEEAEITAMIRDTAKNTTFPPPMKEKTQRETQREIDDMIRDIATCNNNQTNIDKPFDTTIDSSNIDLSMKKIIINSLKPCKEFNQGELVLKIPVDLTDNKEFKKIFIKKQISVISNDVFYLSDREYLIEKLESDTIKKLLKKINDLSTNDDLLMAYSLNKNLDTKMFEFSYIVVENYKKTYINNITIKNIINIIEHTKGFNDSDENIKNFDSLDNTLTEIITLFDDYSTISSNNRIYKYDKTNKLEDLESVIKDLMLSDNGWKVGFDTIIFPTKILNKFKFDLNDETTVLKRIDDVLNLNCNIYYSDILDDILLFKNNNLVSYHTQCFEDKYHIKILITDPEKFYNKIIIKYN